MQESKWSLSEFVDRHLEIDVAIGVLVTVHEFGHFWVARKLGVKVLRFSIGFGKPLWSRRFGGPDSDSGNRMIRGAPIYSRTAIRL